MHIKKSIIAIACMALLASCSQQAEDKKAEVKQAEPAALQLNNENAKASYTIGTDIGRSLQSFKPDLDRAALLAGINDRLDGGKLKLSEADASKAKQAFFQKMQVKKMAEQKAAGAKNKTVGAAFLAENGKKKGVTTTKSGLQYEVIKQGEGAKPKATDMVTVNYRGTLIDGTEFDSSYKRGQPVTFPLNGVIKGWTEGVQLMPVGSTFKFVIPSELAYGSTGAGDKIGPDSVLIFEVELISIGDAKAVK